MALLLSDEDYLNDTSAQKIPKMLKNNDFYRKQNPKNSILSFLNISSDANNFDIMCSIYGKLNFIVPSEPKNDQSFPVHQLNEWLKPKNRQ